MIAHCHIERARASALLAYRAARPIAVWTFSIAVWLALAFIAPPLATWISVVVFIFACLWNTPTGRSER